MFCTQCGTQAISTAKYCAKCGAAVNKSSSPTDTEDQHLKRSYCAAIGKNNDYYIDKFIKFKDGKSYFSWNWAAFLFCIPWTIYRKMYKLAAVFVVILCVRGYQTNRIIENSKINPNLDDVLITSFVITWLAKGTYGIFANALYFKHIDKNLLVRNPTMQEQTSSITPAQTQTDTTVTNSSQFQNIRPSSIQQQQQAEARSNVAQRIPPTAENPSKPTSFSQPYLPNDAARNSAGQYQLAGRSTRFGAVLLDLLFFVACLIPGIVVLSFSSSDRGKWFGFALIAIAFLGICIIQMVFLVKHGQSLGKRALGIKIVSVSDESIPGFVKVYLLRQFVPALICGIPYAGIVVWLADSLFIYRYDRRCLHDLIAETKVVKI